MKKLLLAVCLLALPLEAADLTSPTSTPIGQIYNQVWRDTKDGNNSLTTDFVSANSYSMIAASTTIKSSGGVLHLISVNGTCAGSNLYVADSIAVPAAGISSGIQISTISVTQGTLQYDTRFLNGLTIGMGPASCAGVNVTVSYR